jgi:predicted ABC-type transport system involved in lysophospholipase L1 biosynthesis ATPase subunit
MSVKKDQKELLETLATLSGRTVSDDAVTYQGNIFTVPTGMQGKPTRDVIRSLERILNAAAEVTQIERNFNYHPYDVAAALARVFDKYFGLRAVGGQWTNVVIGPNGESTEVPYGEDVTVPQLGNAEIMSYYNIDYAAKKPIGRVIIKLPRNLTAQGHGVFEAVEAELKGGSLFQGKAIDANWVAPSFTDPYAVDANKVVYTKATEMQLRANLWSVLRHREKLTKLGIPVRRAVVLPGPYGTGKSLGALVTAQIALENGWTFIQTKPDQDLTDAFMAAKVYAPAVVFVEDIDTRAATGTDGDELSKILDIFDGIDRKASGDIVVVLTTNHIERIHKGMLRPGRVDAVINVERLDAEAITRLVNVTSPIPIDGDFDAIVESMQNYTPAFIVEAVGRAVRYAIDRTGGELPDQFTSEDLVLAADGLRPQYDLMVGTTEKVEPSLDRALKDAVAEVVNSTKNGALVH